MFDSILPYGWFQKLRAGLYSHSFFFSYTPDRLQEVNENTISMPLLGNEQQATIKTLVEHVKSWTDTVSKEYSQDVKYEAIANQRRKEETRIAEIKRIEREKEINSTINEALKNLL